LVSLLIFPIISPYFTAFTMRLSNT